MTVRSRSTTARYMAMPVTDTRCSRIAAAWQVVERLGLSVLKVDEGWQARKSVAMYDDSSVTADTAPLAICLAALKWAVKNWR